MKKLFVLALLLLLSAALFSAARAQSGTDFYVQPAGDDPAAKSARAVDFWQKSNGTVYLFLPTGFDAARLRVFCPDGASVNGTALKNGQETDVFAGCVGKTVKLAKGGKSYDLKVMQSRNIGTVFLTTESGNTEYIDSAKGNREKGTILALSPDGGVLLEDDLAYIKSRGNGTFNQRKIPYGIKLAHKAELYGMAAAKDWVLLANFLDYSLIRNKMCMDMALEAEMVNAVHSVFVDLYIDHEYWGNYQLSEKVEIAQNRIDIRDLEEATQAVNGAPLDSYPRFGTNSYKKNTRKGFNIPVDPEDITGGYLVQFEMERRYRDEPSGLVTKQGQSIHIISPSAASRAQVDYIGNLLQELEDALFASDGVNKKTGKHWYEYVDADSYVMLCLLEETTKNYDANFSSLFLYKPPDDVSTLLIAGPGWDFDLSFDNGGLLGPKATIAITSTEHYHWFPHAHSIPDFRERARQLYREKFRGYLGILAGQEPNGKYLRSIREYADEVAASAAMNYERHAYTTWERRMQTGSNFAESVQRMITFTQRRQGYMDEWWPE